MSESHSHTKGTQCHSQRARDQQRLTTPFLYREDGNECKEDIDDTHEDSDDHRILHTHVAEDTRCVVKYSIDTYSLLEDREHNTDEDTHSTIGHQFLGLLYQCLLDGL